MSWEVQEVPGGMGPVRFVADDEYGLWKVGDVAEDLGWESILTEDDPDFLPIRLLKLKAETLCLERPFKRGLVELVF